MGGSMPSWIQEKTIYSPGFSRYSARILDKSTARSQLNISPQQQVVLVLNGKGGSKHSLAKVTAAALATPEWLWLVIGHTDCDCSVVPDNVSVRGWREDTYLYLKAADVAIASAGHNTVMELGTAKIPFICIPEERPFDEQKIKAQLLQKFGLCTVLESFPSSNYLKDILQKLKNTNTNKWNEIMAINGAAQAAKAIESEVRLLNYWHKSAKLAIDNAI